MRAILFIFFLLPTGIILSQPDSSFRVVRSVSGDFSYFTADNLGNLYLVSRNNQLKKINPRGDSMGVFNDVRKYGKLSSIDATNPLKTILFYKDFRTLVVLDRLLNAVNTIDLRRQNIFQVKTVAQSYDNKIWVFDEQESKLKKIGEDGKTISETADLRLVFDEAPVPSVIFDQNGFVYLYDPLRGMYIFDYYGALKNRLPLLGWQDVQVIGNTILGRKEGRLLTYATGSLQLTERNLPESIRTAENIMLSPQGIYVLTQAGVRIFSL